MKDGYSFHTGEADFQREYQQMAQTYSQIFQRLQLEAEQIEADNGYIGGEYCHEFVVESEVGESRYFVTEDGKYKAHEDVAVFRKQSPNPDEPAKPLKKVSAARGRTMQDGAEFHHLPLWRQIKDVVYVDEKGRFILAVIRGDWDVNETKLLHAASAYHLRPATDEEIRQKLNSEPGFISPVGIRDQLPAGVELLIVGDDSLPGIKNAYGGANQPDTDYLNINYERDYQVDVLADIAMAQAGFLSPDGQPLIAKKGIEVGNIFQLGTHYSNKMKDVFFIDEQGERKPYYMGCYGIGIGRTMATIVEVHHDQRGIIWPEIIAPYQVHLIGINLKDQQVKQQAEAVYHQLEKAGIEVLYDDRPEVSAGEKFADADLIGVPYRLVVSAKTKQQVEFKPRQASEAELLELDLVIQRLRQKEFILVNA